MANNAEVVGREWDDGFHAGIRKINLTFSDYAIGSIQVFYNLNGQEIAGNNHYAGNGFPKNDTIQLLLNESIVKVTGYTSPIANREAVRSLKFTTSQGRVLGPYPPNIKEENFNLPIEGGREVVGFKGVTDGILNAIGVHSVPRKN